MKKLRTDLWLLKGGSPKDQEAQILLKEDQHGCRGDSQKAPYPHIQPQGFPMPRTTGLHFGRCLRSGLRQNSIYRTGFLACRRTFSKCRFSAALSGILETPFLAWSVRNAVEIDEDLLLFQLGLIKSA